MSINTTNLPETVETQKDEIDIKIEKDIDIKTKYRLQSNQRIIVKSVIYRIIALLITFLITYLFTNNFRKSFKVSVFIESLQFISYFIYEMVWNNINWGYSI
tara:strand:+ start:1284 stop:1589 length:306 start_codon:yes stop_codon:yes gene_type:complete